LKELPGKEKVAIKHSLFQTMKKNHTTNILQDGNSHPYLLFQLNSKMD